MKVQMSHDVIPTMSHEVISNNVAFCQVKTQMGLYRFFLSLETQNDVQSVA